MSAMLLWWWWAIVLATQIEAAFLYRNGREVIENKTSPLTGNDLFVYNPNRKIVVEEVDKNGKSVLKELELPDYQDDDDDREKFQYERKKIEEKEKNHRSEKSTDNAKRDLYGCDNRRENQRRKCLKRQKKFLKTRYRNWKALIRRIIKDLEGKIKTIGHDSRRQSTKQNLNFTSAFSPKNVMRKKE